MQIYIYKYQKLLHIHIYCTGLFLLAKNGQYLLCWITNNYPGIIMLYYVGLVHLCCIIPDRSQVIYSIYHSSNVL